MYVIRKCMIYFSWMCWGLYWNYDHAYMGSLFLPLNIYFLPVVLTATTKLHKTAVVRGLHSQQACFLQWLAVVSRQCILRGRTLPWSPPPLYPASPVEPANDENHMNSVEVGEVIQFSNQSCNLVTNKNPVYQYILIGFPKKISSIIFWTCIKCIS